MTHALSKHDVLVCICVHICVPVQSTKEGVTDFLSKNGCMHIMLELQSHEINKINRLTKPSENA